MFKTAALLTGAALVCAASAWSPVMAQGAPQTVSLVRVDVQKVGSGFRATKLVGSTVVNEANETVGKIDDMIVGPDGKASFVVLSVGGFLGVGDKLVAVPQENLRFGREHITLPGGTKEQLKTLPEFKYASK